MVEKTDPAERFAPAPKDKIELEEGKALTPRFDANGLITAVVTDVTDGTVLMVAHMNSEALALTISTATAHYYSRSRKALWKKGESSGNLQTVHEILTDCDQDAVVLKVSVGGHDASCHTGRRSCFYRRIELGSDPATLAMNEDQPLFDPEEVYAGDH